MSEFDLPDPSDPRWREVAGLDLTCQGQDFCLKHNKFRIQEEMIVRWCLAEFEDNHGYNPPLTFEEAFDEPSHQYQFLNCN